MSRISKPRIIAVIPARGGSKSIPRKNLMTLKGHPLISYSIQTALRCSLIDDVFVSTEDREIMQVAKEYGAKVVERPFEYALDASRDDELLIHLIEHLEPSLNDEDILVFLRPTHPIRNPETVDRAISLFLETRHFDSLRSMKLSQEIPYKMFEITPDKSAKPIFKILDNGVKDPINAPRQLLPITYSGDAYVDVFKVKTVKKFGNTTGEKILPFVVSEFSQDIDTFYHFELIESFMNNDQMPSWFEFPIRQL